MALRKDAVFDKCPKCKMIGSLRRSRGKSAIDHAIKKSGFLNIYRCKECGWRGVKSFFSFHSISFKQVLFYIVLVLISAYIIKYLLQRFLIK